MFLPFRRGRALALLGALPLAACAVTPEPLSTVDLGQQAAHRLQRAAAIRTQIKGVLTLDEAIRRAVAYNLDHHVEIYEAALRQAELGVSTAAMLPGLVAGATSTGRDKHLASSSYNVITQSQNFGASTSQDRLQQSVDIALSWNILDFGLSYVRARQTADKVLIAQENRRRIVHKLVEDVRAAYWRAYASEQLHGRMEQLEQRTAAALSRSLQQAKERETSPVSAMTLRREIIEIQRAIRELRRELVTAKIQLAALVNETPNAELRLVKPNGANVDKTLSRAPHELIGVALERRSELREISYRRRINAHELDAALLELLPGIQLFAGPNFDSNSYLLHDHWVSWGAKASWNVMRLFQHPHRREVIEAQDALLEQRDRAMTLTVMTQIYVSRARMTMMSRESETARAYASTQASLVRHIKAQQSAEKVSEQTMLREELNDVVAQVRMYLAEANVQGARAALIAAVGMDPPTLTTELPQLEAGDAGRWRARVHLASERK